MVDGLERGSFVYTSDPNQVCCCLVGMKTCSHSGPLPDQFDTTGLHDHPLAVVGSRAGIEAQMSFQSNADLRISQCRGIMAPAVKWEEYFYPDKTISSLFNHRTLSFGLKYVTEMDLLGILVKREVSFCQSSTHCWNTQRLYCQVGKT